MKNCTVQLTKITRRDSLGKRVRLELSRGCALKWRHGEGTHLSELFTVEHMSQIRTLREDRGWTQEELAFRAGISQSIISQYETGTRSMTMKLLQKIADALDCAPAHLIDKEDKLESVSDAMEMAFDLLKREMKDESDQAMADHLLLMVKTLEEKTKTK